MMRKIRELLKNKALLLDFSNLLVGFLMLVSLFSYGSTRSAGSLYLVIFSGGAMNLLNGYKFYQQKAKRNIGMSMMLLGAVILFLGFYVILG